MEYKKFVSILKVGLKKKAIIEESYIYIIAIAHCHRRPDYWIDRMLEKE